MAKKVEGYIKLQIPAGNANPAPPVGPALGQKGVNIMDFCKTVQCQNARPEGNDHTGGHHGLCRQILYVHLQDTASSSSFKESSRTRFSFRRT